MYIYIQQYIDIHIYITKTYFNQKRPTEKTSTQCVVCAMCSVVRSIAVYCSVLQCIAVYCSVWSPTPTLRGGIFCGHTATHCNTLQRNIETRVSYQSNLLSLTHCNALQHTATHCNTLQYAATFCNTLQHTATHCRDMCFIPELYAVIHTQQHTATPCKVLQHTATLCNTLQHTATHCNTLQHTATHCNTL